MSVLPPIHSYVDILEAIRPPSPLNLPPRPPKPRTLMSVQQYLHSSSASYQRAITKLPSEILHEIFRLYFTTSPPLYVDKRTSGALRPGLYTNLDQQLSPFVLSHVCAAWRAVITNSPRFWSQLVIVGPLHHQSYAICTWLTRACNMHIDVTLIQLDLRSSPQELEEATDEALGTILSHSTYVKRLRLEFRCSEWQWSLSRLNPRKLGRLEEIHVEYPPWASPLPDRDRFWANIFQAPNLNRVSWESTDLCPPVHLSRWQHLTSINIGGRITQRNLWSILKTTPRLVRLSVRGICIPTPLPRSDPHSNVSQTNSIPYINPPPSTPFIFRPFTHSSITHLDVEFRSSPTTILQNLRLPCLTSLKISQNSTGYDPDHPRLPMNALIQLILSTSSRCGLTHLTILDPTASETRLGVLLSMEQLSSLEYLGLEYATPRLIDRLNPTMIRDDESVNTFPKLRKLEVFGHYEDGDLNFALPFGGNFINNAQGLLDFAPAVVDVDYDEEERARKEREILKGTVYNAVRRLIRNRTRRGEEIVVCLRPCGVVVGVENVSELGRSLFLC